MEKSKIDKLFQEKKEEPIPDDVVEAIKEIIKRNDKIGLSPSRRISQERCLAWIKEEFGYNLGRRRLCRLLHSMGRQSWVK